eukprot:2885771-Ditylum_brightwellii.AAC.1
MKAQNKSTSSSLSGQHYGHYKATLISDDISLAHTRIMSLPFLLGFKPSWENALDVMVEKDAGNPKIFVYVSSS